MVEKEQNLLALKEFRIDLLTDSYQEIITSIEEDVPDSFRVQTTLAVFFFAMLEGEINFDLSSNDVLRKSLDVFAQRLAEAPFVTRYYSRHDDREKAITNGQVVAGQHRVVRKRIKKLPPSEVFPEWIDQRQSVYSLNERQATGLVNIPNFYHEWVAAHSFKTDQLEDGQIYHRYQGQICPPVAKSPAGLFKAYIEQDYDQTTMREVFAKLAEHGLHPHTTKMYGGDQRLVLYWTSLPAESLIRAITEVFDTHQLNFRGFAQDSRGITVAEDGGWKVKTFVSNDQSLSRGRFLENMTKNTYEPINFLKSYLEQCFQWARNPIDPSLMSFFIVDDRRRDKETPIKEEAEIEEILASVIGDGMSVFKGDRFKLFKND